MALSKFYYFSHTFPDPSLAAGASSRPASSPLIEVILLAASAWPYIILHDAHALLPPLLLQVLCCMLFTGVAKGGTRGLGGAMLPVDRKRKSIGNWSMPPYISPTPNNSI